MVTLEDFLTDLYSLFDQKIHCTLEQQNLVFSGKIDRINFADFCYENQKFSRKIAQKIAPKSSPEKSSRKIASKIAPKKPRKIALKNRPEKSLQKFFEYLLISF